MTANTSIDLREVIFINADAEACYKALPKEIGETADFALSLLQNGRVPERRGLWRMLKGNLSGMANSGFTTGQTRSASIYGWDATRPSTFWTQA